MFRVLALALGFLFVVWALGRIVNAKQILEEPEF